MDCRIGWVVDCKGLHETYNITTAGHHNLEGIDTGTIKGGATDQDGNKHHVERSGTTAPGLGQHLFAVPVANTGAVAVFDTAKPRLEIRTRTIPLQQLGHINQLYFLSLRLDHDDK